ncbi:maleylpyruvate isomerase family mycothiol-dependent enzyme [Amycolatopsis nigrescens]|uniref:maleylpyruvate isomerase family mycothiol-dependent enzyme n=1 Tax=Amycolatopsis nigrescens TaxID=381445 RepID=UPI0003644E85|nr:maleylpyruvate isomerase family mycothiol-dependent enzyme [Amycolatopsis nigrescens]
MRRAPTTASPSRAEMASAARSAAEEFIALALSAPDPETPVPATPGWSVTDVLGHVSAEPARYHELAHGRGRWPAQVADLPAFNAEQVSTLPTRAPAELAARLRDGLDAFLETIEGFGDDQPLMDFDGDQRVRVDRSLGTLIGEFVVHGHDLARALGRPRRIRPELVPMVLLGQHQVMPGWVDRDRTAGHTATYEFRLRGQETHVYEFHNGHLTVDPPRPGRIDVRISADPVTALLLNYGRIRPWPATLTGKLTAWGRRPWLAAGLVTRFLPP